MSDLGFDLAKALAEALMDQQYRLFLSILRKHETDPALTEERVSKALEPVLARVKQKKGDWQSQVYLCAVADKIAAILEPQLPNKAILFAAGAETVRKEVLSGCDPGEMPVLQDLVFRLRSARSQKNLLYFTEFLHDLLRERPVTETRSHVFKNRFKEIDAESSLVFEDLLNGLQWEHSRQLKYEFPEFVQALTKEQSMRLQERLTDLENERILKEFALDEFAEYSGPNDGITAILHVKESAARLFSDPEYTTKETNSEAIGAVQNLDQFLGKKLPPYTWDQLTAKLGLDGFLGSMGRWLALKAGLADYNAFLQARDLVSAWQNCKLAEHSMLPEGTFSQFLARALKRFADVLLAKARDLLDNPEKWDIEGDANEWKAVQVGLDLVEAGQEEIWPAWCLANEVLELARHQKYPQLRALLINSDYQSSFGAHRTADLIETLKKEAHHEHTRMMSEIRGILHTLSMGPRGPLEQSASIDSLRRLIDSKNVVFTGFLAGYADEFEEVNLWQRLAAGDDLEHIETDIGRLSPTRRDLLQTTLVAARAVLFPEAGGRTSARDYTSNYINLTAVLANKQIDPSSAYSNALREYVNQYCDRVEQTWKQSAAKGDRQAIIESYRGLSVTVRWSELSQNRDIVDRREVNAVRYREFEKIAMVRGFVAQGKHIDAVRSALGASSIIPEEERHAVFNLALSSVDPGLLSQDEVQDLLDLGIRWDTEPVHKLADACFRFPHRPELFKKLDTYRGSLSPEYGQLLRWHACLANKDVTGLRSLAHAGSLSEMLTGAIGRYLEVNSGSDETTVLVWALFGAKLGLVSEPYSVQTSLAVRDSDLSHARNDLDKLPDLFKSLADKFTAQDIETVVADVNMVCDRIFKQVDPWRSSMELSDTDFPLGDIDQLKRDLKWLQPRWEDMAGMLRAQDLHGWSSVFTDVKYYTEDTARKATTVIAIETRYLLQRINSYTRPPSDRIEWLHNWLDGAYDTRIPSEQIDTLRDDSRQHPDLLQGHSRADGDLSEFLQRLESAANRIARWNESNDHFDKRRTAFSDFLNNGGDTPAGLREFVGWYDELESFDNDQSPGVLQKWFEIWRKDSGKGWSPMPDPLRKAIEGSV